MLRHTSALAEALQFHDARSAVAARTAHAKLRIIADVEIECACGYAAKQSPCGCAVYGFGFGGIQPQLFRYGGGYCIGRDALRDNISDKLYVGPIKGRGIFVIFFHTSQFRYDCVFYSLGCMSYASLLSRYAIFIFTSSLIPGARSPSLGLRSLGRPSRTSGIIEKYFCASVGSTMAL